MNIPIKVREAIASRYTDRKQMSEFVDTPTFNYYNERTNALYPTLRKFDCVKLTRSMLNLSAWNNWIEEHVNGVDKITRRHIRTVDKWFDDALAELDKVNAWN